MGPPFHLFAHLNTGTVWHWQVPVVVEKVGTVCQGFALTLTSSSNILLLFGCWWLIQVQTSAQTQKKLCPHFCKGIKMEILSFSIFFFFFLLIPDSADICCCCRLCNVWYLYFSIYWICQAFSPFPTLPWLFVYAHRPLFFLFSLPFSSIFPFDQQPHRTVQPNQFRLHTHTAANYRFYVVALRVRIDIGLIFRCLFTNLSWSI